MSIFRAPPDVLPSLRDLTARFEDRSTEAWSDDIDEMTARLRAASAPCPAFEVDPSAVLPPMPRVFRYVPPPPTFLPGPERAVFS